MVCLRAVLALVGLAAFLSVGQAASLNACQLMPTCALAAALPGCGWCWQSTLTRDQQHGARLQQEKECSSHKCVFGLSAGNTAGPTDGSPCSDWTYEYIECMQHVDCNALPDCQNILGTYCGWCEDTKTGMRGNASGPEHGQCSNWISSIDQCANITGPQHVHLSYAQQDTSMMVTFACRTNTTALATYASANDAGSESRQVPAVAHAFNGTGNPDGLQYIYRAELVGLERGAYYKYSVACEEQNSSTFTFQAKPRDPSPGNDWEAKFLVWGDMGRHGGSQALDRLTLEASDDHRNVTTLIHFGDFAYDLDDNGGINGDTFMTRIQQLASHKPYMTCVGNHEIEDGSFSNYLNRFTMPRYDVNNGWDMLWHSWDVHLVHFISYSTEVYFSNKFDIQRQYDWLEADLQAANANRTLRPWIIAFGHRPMYCSNLDGDDCTKNSSVVRAGLEDLFHKYGVDIVFEAHEHSYERLWPTYNNTVTQFDYINPKAAVHLVSGAAGCNEANGACLNPILTGRLPWSAFRSSAQGTYSFGHLNIHNSTHAYFDSYVVEEERVEDFIWIIQEHHGLRNMTL
ncbi:uncharacterized protein MONBRDRAFT_26397 [Monosiga brevicollis MX1]|uniref:Purple acid phosphatase n=1 Tax=Monosiga brevicollis TaxID=81824 RepID=A9V290_MONBE|nr:uncharacterized protein MONBRDRAFT_26397 [Monosiga brevicollis MX1]EDQ88216.1 predicted protein [Monosiga brevicollis MX1]|eukprot:XP_001746809.1 hypothetical protein [Monosiga brevicollis MX1]